MCSVTTMRSDPGQPPGPDEAICCRTLAAAPSVRPRLRDGLRMAAACLAIVSPLAPGAAADMLALADERTLFSEIPSVFAASRFEQSASDAPADVTVVTAADIERRGYRTLADVLRAVRGLAVTNDYNYSYVAARGFALTGDYNTRILLLQDGHRLNDNVFDQALLGQEGVLDIGLVERIEIVRGPGSSLYGSNALFAVVNVVTRRGRDLQGAAVRVEAGDRGGSSVNAAAGQRLPGGTEYLVSVGTGRDPGERRLDFPAFARMPGGGYAIDADTDRWRRAFAKVRQEDLEVTAGFSNRVKSIPTASFGTTFNDNRTQTLDERSFLHATYARAVGIAARLELRASFDEYRFAGDYFQSVPSALVTRDRLVSRSFALGAEWNQRLGAHRLVGGADWERDMRTNFTSTDAYVDAPAVHNTDIRDGRSHQAAFLQDEWRLAEGLLASLGLRYDRFRGFPGQASPRAALVWQLDPATTFKLLYGHAFRTPNLNELFYFDGQSSQANPNLRPERIRNAEFVAAHQFGSHLHATASLYRYRITGLITQDESRNDLLMFGNNEEVTVVGASLGLEGQLNRGLEWKLDLAHDTPRANWTRRDLNVAARRQAKAGLSIPMGAFARLGLESLYEGPRHTLEGGRIGGQTLTNIALTAAELPGGFKARITAFNALDRRLLIPAGPEFALDTLTQPRRSVWLTLEATLP